jgi:hypothetical protein
VIPCPDAHRAPLQKHLRTPLRKFITTLLAAFLLALPPLSAAPREDTAPALSVGKVVESPSVIRGGSCEVIIRGIAMPGDSVEFKIQKPPTHGSLQGPRRIDRDTVAYAYQHGGEKGHSSDRVLFKLKTGPGKSWGTLQAEIVIEEPPPGMEFENPELDFGPVPIGGSRTLPLVLRNSGGGALEGTIKVTAPWIIDGPATFQLAESGALPLRVTFQPDGPSLRKGRLSVSAGGLQQSAILTGEGIYRFDAPGRISFGKTADSDQLDLPLSNTTDAPLRLAISAPPPLVCKSEITLPPRGSTVLPLALEKRHYTEKSVDLALADGAAVRTLRVDLPPPPALLQWDAPEGAIDLGDIAPRHIPRPEFQLANRGSTAAIVELRGGGGLVPDPEQPQTFELAPGAEATVKTVWRLADGTGPVSGSIIASHGGMDHILRVAARIVEAEPREKKNPEPLSEAAAASTPEPIRILGESEQAELLKRLPSNIAYRLVPAGRRATAIVSWNYSGPEPVRFSLEKKVVKLAPADFGGAFDKRLQVPEELPQPASNIRWVAAAEKNTSPASLGNGTWEATATGLTPGYHQLRIATRTPPDGNRTDYSTFTVRVDPIPPHPAWKWLAALLGASCLIYLLRKKIARPL